MQKSYKKRTRARVLAMQALYQWHMTQDPVENITSQFENHNDPNKVDLAYFAKLFMGTVRQIEEIQQLIVNVSDRPIERFYSVDLSIVQIICYELLSEEDISHQILISEGVDIAANYGAEEGYRFVNALLNQLAHKIRDTGSRGTL